MMHTRRSRSVPLAGRRNSATDPFSNEVNNISRPSRDQIGPTAPPAVNENLDGAPAESISQSSATLDAPAAIRVKATCRPSGAMATMSVCDGAGSAGSRFPWRLNHAGSVETVLPSQYASTPLAAETAGYPDPAA